MSERQSALPGAAFTGAVRVTETGLRGMVTLKGDLSSNPLKDIAKEVSGAEFPDPRGARVKGETGLCWMAPDEVLILCAHADATGIVARIETALAGTHFLAANVSDARAVFRVEGPLVREVLAKLTPADLHPDSFHPGEIRRTRLAQVPAAFWMTGPETFEIICFRSVAQYVFDLLSNAARPRAEVDYF